MKGSTVRIDFLIILTRIIEYNLNAKSTVQLWQLEMLLL